MASEQVTQFITRLEEEIGRIWLEEPEEIALLRDGYLPSGAGVYDQYFTVLVMLSGEMRSLAIHTFADLIHFAQEPRFHLHHLQLMVRRMLRIDLDVIGYFGLPTYAKYLEAYYHLVPKLETKQEFLTVTKRMFTLTNRYQMWLHQIFPWGVALFYKKRDPEQLAKLQAAMKAVKQESEGEER